MLEPKLGSRQALRCCCAPSALRCICMVLAPSVLDGRSRLAGDRVVQDSESGPIRLGCVDGHPRSRERATATDRFGCCCILQGLRRSANSRHTAVAAGQRCGSCCGRQSSTNSSTQHLTTPPPRAPPRLALSSASAAAAAGVQAAGQLPARAMAEEQQAPPSAAAGASGASSSSGSSAAAGHAHNHHHSSSATSFGLNTKKWGKWASGLFKVRRSISAQHVAAPPPGCLHCVAASTPAAHRAQQRLRLASPPPAGPAAPEAAGQ